MEPLAFLLSATQENYYSAINLISLRRAMRPISCDLPLALLAVILIFFLCFPSSFLLLPFFFLPIFLSLLLSRSKCLHFLQQTASRGTRVYFATCGDGSLPRQELAASCCWFLTCVHPFTSTAVRSSFPPKTLKDSRGENHSHVETIQHHAL